MQFGGGSVKCDFNYLNLPLLAGLRSFSSKPLSSSVGAQLSSCGSAVDSSHLILITLEEWHSCTPCIGDNFILIDIEINKSYFKLVQL